MAIEFECPNCRTQIRTPDEAAGKKARCPQCQVVSSVPLSRALPSAPFPIAPLPTFASPTQPAGNPAAWLPPADAFAPQGPQQFAPPPGAYQPPPTPPVSSNPFGEQYAPSTPGSINPYQSPSAYASPTELPLTPEELRQKLLGPAIGMTIGAVLSIGLVVLFAAILLLDENFHKDLNKNGNGPAAYAAFAFFVAIGVLPSLISLLAPWAMFRGSGLATAWVGTIAGFLPCGPCFLISIGFSIWSVVLLIDPRVQKGMQ